MRAIRVANYGGPEVLEYVELPDPEPGPDQLLVRVAAAGVNYIDVYHRTGRYPLAQPFCPGLEGAGVVERAGADVREFSPGDRVAWASAPGSYAELVLVNRERAVALPAGITLEQAAAAMLQGMTAHYLVKGAFRLGPGHSALVHAAAGGVGLLLVQMAHRLGARVIGTVSTDEKARLAREAGADELILYNRIDFQSEVKRLTGNIGVDVVYDSVGRSTFEGSLSSLKPLGYLVLYGASSGPVPPIDPIVLSQGSLFLTRPSLVHYTADRETLLWRAGEVLDQVAGGELKLRIHKTYKLADAAEAHRDLESRSTTGKLILLP